MRTLRPKPKRKVHAQLPEELRGFLTNVLDMIDHKVPEAMIESDDLLQAEFVYGGRIHEAGDEWGFTYFPQVGHRGKWELRFSKAQLAEIASGRVAGVELFECTDPNCGNRFSAEDDTCFYCDYE